MHKNILYFLAILLMPLLSPAAPVLSLAGVDDIGAAMRFGSGAWTESFCHPALVSNDGTVLFIAQMPDVFLDGADNRDRFRAVYQRTKADDFSAMLIEGYDLAAEMLFGKKWWYTTWQVSGTGARDEIFLVREDLKDDAGNSTLNLRRFPNDKSIVIPSEVNKQTLRLARGGEMVAVTADNLQKPLFYQVADDGFSAADISDDAFSDYTQKSIALSPDGNRIYLASTKDMGEGELGLYAYDRNQQSHKLVDFIGKSTLDSQVQCAAAAEVVVYRSRMVAGALVSPQIFVSWRDHSGNYISQLCSPGELTDCADPQISADGRFVVFSAITPDSDFRQIFRFDRLAGELEQVAWANADAHTPAISPNGRYVALVSAATNFGHDNITLPQVWLADIGPTLLDASLDIFQQQTLELPIEVSGTSEYASITLLPDEPVPAGTFYDKDGNSLSLSQEYSLDSLPWRYQAGETESGTVTVSIQITDGTFSKTADLQIHIYDKNKAILSCVSLNTDGEFIFPTSPAQRIFNDASCSEDGSKIAFVTSFPLDPVHTINVLYAYFSNLTGGGAILLRKQDEPIPKASKIAISGDGNVVYFTGEGKLWQYTVATGQLTELFSSGINNIKPATDVSGSIVAYSQNGKAVLKFPGQDSCSPAPDLTCKALRLNRDGKVLALLDNAGALHIWFADASELAKLADNVTEFAMNQAGTEVFFLQDKKLFRQNTALDGATEVPLPAGITATNLKNLQVSGNGRFLTWVRDLTLNEVPYPGQQFLFDVSTLQEHLISNNSPDQPGNDLSEAPFPAAFSASGRSLFFASLASNLLDGDNNNAQDLFLAILPELPADAPSVSPDILPALEDTPADLSLNLDSPQKNVLVPLLVSGESVHGAQLALLGPVPGRNGYAVHYKPVQNFCGSDSFQVRLWDGAALSAPQTVNVNVENVNDPPVAQSVTVNSLAEGTTLTLNLLDLATDPDLNNPIPDTLTFTLQEGFPAWAGVEGIQLRLTPDFLTVTHAESGREFAFKVLVCDNQGLEVEMPVTISVTDVNQPPTLQLTRDTIIQQGDLVTLPADLFAGEDTDPEDQKSLLIWLLAGDLTFELDISDFPYTFTPPADVADQLQFAVYAKDAQGMTSERKSLTILLRKVTFQTADAWGYSELEEKPSWEELRYGWNLLAIPFAVSAAEISGIFGPGAVLWVWNTENNRYTIANTLDAGQGFWIYIDDLSAINTNAQILSKGRTDPPTPEPGWNLRGTDWQNTELPAGWMLSPSRNWEKTDDFLPGKAYWFFIPRATEEFF
jgi:hypothetical protein